MGLTNQPPLEGSRLAGLSSDIRPQIGVVAPKRISILYGALVFQIHAKKTPRFPGASSLLAYIFNRG